MTGTIAPKNKMYISELISDDILTWRPSIPVLINSGCGSGKTAFVIGQEINENDDFDVMLDKMFKGLPAMASASGSKILLVVNRTHLKQQIIDELDKLGNDHVQVITYQYVNNLFETKGELFNTSAYSYIVFDECHYWVTDCSFSSNSHFSYKLINNSPHAIKIFMTATESGIFGKIRNDFNNDVKQYDFPHQLDHIEYFMKFGQLKWIEPIMKTQLKHGEKSFIFADNINFFTELYNSKDESGNYIYRNDMTVVFANSNNNKQLYDIMVNEKSVVRMITTSKLQSKHTCATSVLDAGFNIKDDDLSIMIINTKSVFKVVQAIGRYRDNGKGKKIKVFIREVSKSSISKQFKEEKEPDFNRCMAIDLDCLNENDRLKHELYNIYISSENTNAGTQFA